MSTVNDRTRIVELDGLRGLAALAVVLFHYTTNFERLYAHSTAPWIWFPWGEYGVDFFFILSGFVILMTLDRTQSAGQFVFGRLARLYPAFWAACGITYTVVSYFGLPGQEVGPGEALANGTMIEQILGARHIDGAYWSLQVELFFYAAMLLLHRSGALGPRRWRLTLPIWLVFAVAVGTPFAKQYIPSTRIQTILSLKYLHLFAIGVVLYRVRQDGRWTAGALALLACCVSIQGCVDTWAGAALVAAFAAIIDASAAGRLRLLSGRPLVFLGAISYPLYLIHQNVGYVIIRSLEGAGLGATLAVMSAIAVSMVVAAGLSYFIERPVMAVAKRRPAHRHASDELVMAS